MKAYSFIVTVREVRAHSVTVRAISLADALTRIANRVDRARNKPIQGFNTGRLLSRVITNCKDAR